MQPEDASANSNTCRDGTMRLAFGTTYAAEADLDLPEIKRILAHS